MLACLMSRSRYTVAGIALLAAGACVVSLPAWSQSGTGAGSNSCFVEPARLSDQAIERFLESPAGLLTGHPEGGTALSNAVRSLAGSDIRTVDALIQLAAKANPSVKAAIAAGLANAASTCVRTRPDIAQLIQEKIAASEDSQLITAFLSVAGAIDTAALGSPGAGGGPAGGPGGIGGTQSGPGGIGPNAVPQGGGLGSIASNYGSTGSFSRGGAGGFNPGNDSGGPVSPSVQ